MFASRPNYLHEPCAAGASERIEIERFSRVRLLFFSVKYPLELATLTAKCAFDLVEGQGLPKNACSFA